MGSGWKVATGVPGGHLGSFGRQQVAVACTNKVACHSGGGKRWLNKRDIQKQNQQNLRIDHVQSEAVGEPKEELQFSAFL